MIKIIHVSENILLKQLEHSDADDIFHTIINQQKYLGKWLPFVEFTLEIEDTKKYIQSIVDSQKENCDCVFVIRFKDEFAGLIGLKGTDKPNKKTEIGYWLSEPFQKNGIMTASVRSLVQFAYNNLDINRVQIKCAVGNIPSKNIPKRLGFELEGIERDGELLSGGIFTDLEVYSKLKNESEKS
ncbi:MAG: GNAT family protein [Bacteroidales bacterium]|nr:GNAT family protein [Bacteroidales bacterium]